MTTARLPTASPPLLLHLTRRGLAYLSTLEEQGIHAQALWVFDDSETIPQSEHTFSTQGYTIVTTPALFDHVRVS